MHPAHELAGIGQIRNTVALIDADSLVYRSAIYKPTLNSARTMLDNIIDGIIESVNPWQVSIFIKDPNDRNFRSEICTDYKGHRSLKPEDRAKVQRLYEDCWNRGWTSNPAGEAEDHIGVWNARYIENGLTPIMCHCDKDLNQLVGHHYNFDKKLMYTVPYRWGFGFLALQALGGDATDNLHGIPGVRVQTASKLLSNIHMKDLWSAIIDLYQKKSTSPDGWERHLWETFNGVFIRYKEEDIEPLHWERIEEIMTWKGPAKERYNHNTVGCCISPHDSQNMLEMYPQLLSEGARHFPIPTLEEAEDGPEEQF